MPDKSKLPKYKRDKSGNPIVFDVISVATGEIVASSASRVRARNIALDLDPTDTQYVVRIRVLTIPKEDRENDSLLLYETFLRQRGVGLFVRCAAPGTGITFELWRTLDARRPIMILLHPDGRFTVFAVLTDSSDPSLIQTTAQELV